MIVIRKICFSALLLIVFFGILGGQDRHELLRLELSQLDNLIQSAPELVNKDLFDFFYKSVEKSILDHDYEKALRESKNTVLIADKVNSSLIRFFSNYQMGKIFLHLNEHKKAKEALRKAAANISDAVTRNPDLARNYPPELAYLYYYIAFTYSDPRFIPNDLTPAFENLRFAYVVSDSVPNSEFDDVFVRTSLQISRAFGLSGHPIAKLLWIDNAKLRFSKSIIDTDEQRFEILRESWDAYDRIGDKFQVRNHVMEMEQASKTLSIDSRLSYLWASAGFLGSINQIVQKHRVLNEGIILAADSQEWLIHFYSSRMFQFILDKNVERAESDFEFLKALNKKDPGSVNAIELYVGKAVILHQKNDFRQSERYFKEAERFWIRNGSDWDNGSLLYGWWSQTMLFKAEYQEVVILAEKYLRLIFDNNQVDSLPFIYRILATAYLRLGEFSKARLMNQKGIEITEAKRRAPALISTGIFEHLFEAYQVRTALDLREGELDQAFASADQSKARWLNDRIEGNLLSRIVQIDSDLRNKIFDLSVMILQNPRDPKLFLQLSELERKALSDENSSERRLVEIDDRERVGAKLRSLPFAQNTVLVSFSFSDDSELFAFVWRPINPQLIVTKLEEEQDEIDGLAETIQTKIKNRVFFKRDGKELYDKLIKPLNIDAKHLIIIPDKALWKIPFQALSPDGKKYLIEDTKISYAPSVSILLKQLKNPKPDRKSFQVFSNATYNNRYLKFADVEAKRLAKLYGVQPTLNSSESTFVNNSAKSDINHFSMHAEVNRDEPFNSFLAFKPTRDNDGKLTVDELLKMKVKQGSLAFLASCDTNNVFNGEGLVSLSWGMMAAGASTVVYTQWEANDESTGRFTEAFYRHYKNGASSAEAMQKASIEMINDKSSNMNEPYYWAEFVLTGDYR